MNQTTETLKVNLKSLAAESRIIRQQANKLNKAIKASSVKDSREVDAMRQTRNELNDHRRGKLRKEARVTQLAYAYLRGKPYKTVEPKIRDKWDEKHYGLNQRIADKLNRHTGSKEYTMEAIADWRSGKEPQEVKEAA